ncbi:MAG: MG2 domain-containing protein [Syntrophaceae bacterium]
MMRRFALSLIVVICLFAVCAFAVETPRVEMFSPQGGVKDVRQAVARFSEQMVGFGDPRLEDPFVVQCGISGIKGTGRWIDGRTWTYDFDKDLPAGIVCEFTLKQGTKTLKGEPVGGPAKFSFHTGGPSVRGTIPRQEYVGIDEDQIFLFLLDAEADEGSVLKSVYCSIEGIKEKVGINIVKGGQKDDLMKVLQAHYGRYDKIGRQNIMFQCRQSFPPSAEVKIIWGAGVRAATGIPTEKDQEFTFKSRMPFQAHFECMREKAGAGCIPLSSMFISFSSNISRNDARKIFLKSSRGRTWSPEISGDDQDLTHYVNFPGPFPEKTDFQVIVPKDLKDESGRSLANIGQFPLAVRTDGNPALAKFTSSFGLIEFDKQAVLPLTVRNIEASIKIWEKRIDQQNEKGKLKHRALEKMLKAEGLLKHVVRDEYLNNMKAKLRSVQVSDEQAIIARLREIDSADREKPLLGKSSGAREITIQPRLSPEELQVIGVPFKEPGFYALELESRILGSKLLGAKLGQSRPMYVAAGALVTNMAVHFKHGRSSSLAWVTTLDKGEPVSGAAVSILDCSGKKLWQGKTDNSGVARISRKLPESGYCRGDRESPMYHEYNPALSGIRSGYFVFARKDKDLSFTHSSWHMGIESWRFQVPTDRSVSDPLITHTVFDRTLLRAGQEVHMKHFIRKRTMKDFFVPPERDSLSEIIIEHAGSEQQYSVPVKWKENGTALSAWKVPRDAKLGTYNVYFAGKDKKGIRARNEGGSFRVEEFRVPLMTGFIKGPRETAVNAAAIDVDLSLKYLAGGGASLQTVKLRTEARQKNLYFPDYSEYIFSAGPVKTGIFKKEPPSRDFDGEEEEAASETPNQNIRTREITLDTFGSARARIETPRSDTVREIKAEMEFRDPNGEVQTISSSIPCYPSEYLVGISSEDEPQGNFQYHVAVLDLAGNPVAGARVKVDLFESKTYSHRKRLHGGFYSFESATEVRKIGSHCEGATNRSGILLCRSKLPVAGVFVLQAEAADAKGNIAVTSREMRVYGTGDEDNWSAPRNDDRIDLTPGKKKYEPGQKIRLKAAYPFKEGTALVTVEREGVMDFYVKKITRKSPFIEVPVKRNYVPNIFVSALIVKGRTPNSKPAATFDPGKPSFKLGLKEIAIGWRNHELKVDVETDKKVYATREKVRTKVRVRTADGKLPPRRSELALAVIDEGLLELASNNSWNLLPAMMQRKGCEVQTSTAQMMVTGKRHFGRKALAQGGGGGRQITRELFDTLVYWNGAVRVNEKGEAIVEFPLNDSLTSFRIVAIAGGGKGLFGTGQTSIRASKDLMVLPGIPQVVREGDRYNAGFTVRNLSQKDMNVEAKLTLAEKKNTQQFDPLKIALKPGESREIGWDVKIPLGAKELEYNAAVTAMGNETGPGLRDSVKVSQKVATFVPVRTYQATMARLSQPLNMQAAIPAGAVPGRGGVRVEVMSKIANGLPGITEYMRLYPYSCLEQKASRAVALMDEAAWANIMAELPSYLDADGLAKYFPTMEHGSDVLTSYLLAIGNEAGYVIPRKDHMIAGLKKFVEGKIRRYSVFNRPDLSIRKLSAIEALSRYGGANVAMLDSITVNPAIWPTSAVLDWINILVRVKNIPDRDRKLKEAENTLRTHVYYQGTTMNFSTELSDYLWWLMVTPDVNAARTLLTILELPDWKQEGPLVMRGIIGRLRKGHWDTTTANAWGVLAAGKFSDKYESVPVTGITKAILDKKTAGFNWTSHPKGESALLPWPSGTGNAGGTLTIKHSGTGSPWATVQSLAAIPLRKPLFSGFSFKKTMIPVEQKTKGKWTRGDVARIKLEISSQTDTSWVVVDDPIPAGSVILGSGLGRDSRMMTSGESKSNRYFWQETFRERSFEAMRIYYEYMPKGAWEVEYTIRLNNDGAFNLPRTRVEALYSPEMFGEIPNDKMEIAR